MAEYGIEIRGADGNVILDNDHLTHRLWYWGIHSANEDIIFAEPLGHRPTIVSQGISGGAGITEPIMSGDTCIGVQLRFATDVPSQSCLVVVFARR